MFVLPLCLPGSLSHRLSLSPACIHSSRGFSASPALCSRISFACCRCLAVSSPAGPCCRPAGYSSRGPPAPHSGTLLCLLSLPVLSLLCSFFAEVNRSCRAAGYYLSRHLHRSVWLLTCYFFSSSSSPRSDFSIGCTINLCSSFSQLSQISSIIIIKHVGCNR